MASILETTLKTLMTFLRARSVFFWLGIAMFAALIGLAKFANFNAETMNTWFAVIADSPLAVPATILFYTLTAFVSAPQWMLHGAAVFTFGSVQGAVIAWIATLVSASVDFWLGRKLSPERVHALTGGLVGKFVDVVKKHGFWTSLVVRIVPSGPFVVVNMAAGATRMKFSAFIVGTAIGTIPKIATIAFFGEGIQGALSGKGAVYVGALVLVGAIWVGGIYIAKTKLKAKPDGESTHK